MPQTPALPWQLMRVAKWGPRTLYALGLGPLIGRLILLLTTTGRKTGRARVTPLQYEEEAGVIYVGAARGVQADWYRNLAANPQVEVQVKSRRFRGQAEPITDRGRIADFLELRLRRHPGMVRGMLRLHGLTAFPPSRADLEQLAAQLAVVAIRPAPEEKQP
jgi:deazaflavin-dependent oxidoreductase (nitroreductase family)